MEAVYFCQTASFMFWNRFLLLFLKRISVSNQQLAVNDLKYRYVKMCGEIKEKELMELETVFWDDQYRNLRDTVRNQVERYEEAVRRRAEQLERATVKERKAKKLLDEVKKLRGVQLILILMLFL